MSEPTLDESIPSALKEHGPARPKMSAAFEVTESTWRAMADPSHERHEEFIGWRARSIQKRSTWLSQQRQ